MTYAFRVALGAISFALFASAAVARGESVQASPSSDVYMTFGPYCGLRCLYAAMRFEGSQRSFPILLQTKYLGGSKGSSLLELQSAARDQGFQAVAVQDITESFLSRLRHPLILHVRRDYNAKPYDHYVVLLSVSGSFGRLFDPPEPIKSVPLREIMERSDGVGLVVARSGALESELFAKSWTRPALGALVFFLLICALGHLHKSRLEGPLGQSVASRVTSSLRQAALMLLVCAFTGLTANIVMESGVLASDQVTASPARTHREIDYANLVALMRTRDVIVVDARHAADFALGHIPGALNLPMESDDRTRHERIHPASPQAPIVIYCQSDRCPFANLVAAGLRSDGFTNLFIYRGGWIDWQSHSGTTDQFGKP